MNNSANLIKDSGKLRDLKRGWAEEVRNIIEATCAEIPSMAMT